eukprot:IDg8433t1
MKLRGEDCAVQKTEMVSRRLKWHRCFSLYIARSRAWTSVIVRMTSVICFVSLDSPVKLVFDRESIRGALLPRNDRLRYEPTRAVSHSQRTSAGGSRIEAADGRLYSRKVILAACTTHVFFLSLCSALYSRHYALPSAGADSACARMRARAPVLARPRGRQRRVNSKWRRKALRAAAAAAAAAGAGARDAH